MHNQVQPHRVNLQQIHLVQLLNRRVMHFLSLEQPQMPLILLDRPKHHHLAQQTQLLQLQMPFKLLLRREPQLVLVEPQLLELSLQQVPMHLPLRQPNNHLELLLSPEQQDKQLEQQDQLHLLVKLMLQRPLGQQVLSVRLLQLQLLVQQEHSVRLLQLKQLVQQEPSVRLQPPRLGLLERRARQQLKLHQELNLLHHALLLLMLLGQQLHLVPQEQA